VSAAAGTNAFRCEPLGAAQAPLLAALFERAGSACFCRYFHFGGDKNEWQARLSFEPEKNRAELFERSVQSPPGGMVAFSNAGDAVGWMKLEPALALPKLYAQRTYRNLPVFAGAREGVWVVGCFLVEEPFRRQGVARALLRSGIELARARGVVSLEAFPRRAEGVRPEELWTGPSPLFEAEGFELVAGEGQYPVLRKLL
jgi:GNAT superfamily N-acetyltransferase